MTEKPHQNLRYGPEGRIPIVPAGPGSSRPKRKKLGTPKEGSGKSSRVLVVIVRSYPVSFYPSAIICCCSWHSYGPSDDVEPYSLALGEESDSFTAISGT